MALNKEAGEAIEGLGGMFRVVPTDKWANTNLFIEAAEAATKAFRKSMGRFTHKGQLMKFGRDNVVVQEYPLLNTLAFIFEAKVGNKTMVYPYTFKFPPELISRMSAEGQWDVSLPKKH